MSNNISIRRWERTDRTQAVYKSALTLFEPPFYVPMRSELQQAGYRSADRADLDVRCYEWSPAFTWHRPVVDAVVRTWIPVFDAELGFRSLSRAPLDVRRSEWSPEWGWLRTTFYPTFATPARPANTDAVFVSALPANTDALMNTLIATTDAMLASPFSANSDAMTTTTLNANTDARVPSVLPANTDAT